MQIYLEHGKSQNKGVTPAAMSDLQQMLTNPGPQVHHL